MSILEKVEYHLLRFIVGAVVFALFGSLFVLLYTHAEQGALLLCVGGGAVACWAFGDGLVASYDFWRKERSRGRV